VLERHTRPQFCSDERANRRGWSVSQGGDR
jgi:hypothetical protein